jgi:pimeloyl-ACP methyl ester carboxylesterase
VEKLVVYETPFKTDPSSKYPADDYGARLEEIFADGDPMRAAKHFMRNGIGMPRPLVTAMTLMPMFKKFAANGLTLTFDHAALGEHNMHGRPLQTEAWATVTCPTLVVYGAKTYPVLKHASKALADILPNATLRELPGQKHTRWGSIDMERSGVEAYAAQGVDRLVVGTTSPDLNEQLRQVEAFATLHGVRR